MAASGCSSCKRRAEALVIEGKPVATAQVLRWLYTGWGQPCSPDALSGCALGPGAAVEEMRMADGPLYAAETTGRTCSVAVDG